MPIDAQRYPKNWNEIALSVKEAAGWRCQCCGRICHKPGSRPEGLTRSEWTAFTLSVHHRNHLPEDNRRENLLAVCPAWPLYSSGEILVAKRFFDSNCPTYND